MPPLEDRDLVLEYSTPEIGLPKFAGFGTRDTLGLTAIYPNLLKLAIQAGISDVQIACCPHDSLP